MTEHLTPTMPSSPLEIANDLFVDLKRDNVFVAADEFGGILRNTYTQHMPDAVPDVIISDAAPWSEVGPKDVFAHESNNPNRLDPSADKQRRVASAEPGIQAIRRMGSASVVFDGWFCETPAHEIARAVGADALISQDESVQHLIETKAFLSRYLEEAGATTAQIPKSYSFESASTLPDYDTTAAVVGTKLVVQGQSIGGNGTRIVTSREEYEAAKADLRGRIRVSEFIDAPYSSVYCLSLPQADGCGVDTYVDVPSFKPIGIPELGINNVQGGGGDWRDARPDFDVESMIDNITKLSSYFYDRFGYSGAFVVEGFIRDGGFLFNEVNARPCGSNEINSAYQFQDGVPGFVSMHILSRLGRVTSQLVDSGEFNECTTFRSRNGTPEGAFSVKYKNPHQELLTPSAHYNGSGIYVVDNGGLSWKREGSASTEANFDDGEVLIANGPQPEALIGHRSNVCVVEARGTLPIYDGDIRLNERGQALASAVIGLFERTG